MTDTERHINSHLDRLTFCGRPVPPDALSVTDLEHAQSERICPACLAGVMEYERDGADYYTASIWAEKDPRIFSESFSHLWGVWAYRLLTAQLLAQQGDKIKDFEYTRQGVRHE